MLPAARRGKVGPQYWGRTSHSESWIHLALELLWERRLSLVLYPYTGLP